MLGRLIKVKLKNNSQQSTRKFDEDIRDAQNKLFQ